MKSTEPLEHDLDFIIDPKTYEEKVICCTCGAQSSSLLTWCPGQSLSRETIEACKDGGKVTDLEMYRRRKGKTPSQFYIDEDYDAEGWK